MTLGNQCGLDVHSCILCQALADRGYHKCVACPKQCIFPSVKDELYGYMTMT
jgi:hypothetical protein